jgi:RNA polymerase sigma factor (sigma-70 family)
MFQAITWSGALWPGIRFSAIRALMPIRRASHREEPPLKADKAQSFVTDIATQHGRKLRRYLAARLRNAADVPDLVQEVFLRLMRIERHETIRNPEAYVMTIAGHVLHQHTLRLATRPENLSAVDVLVDLQAALETDPVAAIDAQRRLQALDRALEQLAPNLHATFVLHRRDGMTLEEIAKILGVSRPMVKKYLAKAVLRCREQLEPEESGQAASVTHQAVRGEGEDL